MGTHEAVKWKLIGTCPKCGCSGCVQTYLGIYDHGDEVRCTNNNCTETGTIVMLTDTEYVNWN